MAEDNFQRELYLAVSRGCRALDLKEFLFPLLDRRRDSLINKLESTDYSCQKVDTYDLLVLQLELKVIAMERKAIESAISDGMEAEGKLRELNEPEKLSRPGIKIKF